MSRSFLKALAQKDASALRKCAASYLRQELGASYAQYINNRLVKYEEVLAEISRGKADKILEQAAILWDRQLFYEMHELLEDDWQHAEGEKRLALQGLIRAAGAKIHAENNNTKASISMAVKAQTALLKHRHELAGFDILDDVLAELNNILAVGANRGHDGKGRADDR